MPDATRGARRVLSALEFDVAWESLGLGPTPVVLALPSPGHTHTERRLLRDGAVAALRARGLAGPAGPERQVAELLRRLADPAVRVELRAWWPDPVRALAAGDAAGGVLARRVGDTVEISPCASPAHVATLLTTVPPGPGRSASVPTAALGRRRGGLRAHLVDHGVDPGEAGLVTRMLHGIDRRAQLVAVAGDAAGAPRRSGLLGVLGGPRGHYLVTRSRGADGTDWTTVAPTDARRLRHRVGEQLAQVAQAC